MKKDRQYYRASVKFQNNEKPSRRQKLLVIGRKITKRNLKKLIKSISFTKYKYPCSPEVHPHEFCPRCGCTETRFVSHYVEYPEVWDEYFCLRCGKKVARADNSPYIHVLFELIPDGECFL